jgi:hypothetical protein
VLLVVSDMFFLVSLPPVGVPDVQWCGEGVPLPHRETGPEGVPQGGVPSVLGVSTVHLASLHSASFRFIVSAFETMSMNDGNRLRERRPGFDNV